MQENEFRIDPVTRTVVLISPGRGKRPSDYLDKKPEVSGDSSKCPLCRGNEKETPPTIAFRGETETEWTVRNFDNKFAALDKSAKFALRKGAFGLSSPAFGRHEVIVETDKHGIGLWDLSERELEEVFSVFSERFSEISRDRRIKSVLIFHNYGREAGASLSHIHAQIAGFPLVLPGIEERIKGSRPSGKKCKYCSIVGKELREGKRVVFENKDYAIICPYASVFKYEAMIIPKKHGKGMPKPGEIAPLVSKLFRAYKKLLGDIPFNYAIFCNPKGNLHWHLLAMPKLAIHAGIEKAGGVYINSTPPETAAQELKASLE